MPQDIYDPLAEYIQTFHPRFKEVAGKTFDELADDFGDLWDRITGM